MNIQLNPPALPCLDENIKLQLKHVKPWRSRAEPSQLKQPFGDCKGRNYARGGEGQESVIER